jgi:hypothetical protein
MQILFANHYSQPCQQLPRVTLSFPPLQPRCQILQGINRCVTRLIPQFQDLIQIHH